MFHELAHSTGHKSRLSRGLDGSHSFGSHAYSKEELVAEISAAMLGAETGIEPSVIENQAAYVQGWLKRLRNDKRFVVDASQAAQKAADLIQGRKFNN